MRSVITQRTITRPFLSVFFYNFWMLRFLKNYLWIAGALLLVLIVSTLNLERIGEIISGADFGWMAVALVSTLITILGKGLKWHELLLNQKSKVSIWESTELFLKGFFLSMITPGRVGDFSRALFLRERLGFVPALASVILDRLIDIVTLLVLSFVALAAFFGLFGRWIVDPWLIVAVFVILVIVVAYVLKQKQTGFFRNILFALIPEKYASKARESYNDLVKQIRGTMKKPSVLAVPVGIGLVNWGFSILTGFSVGRALGIAQPFYFFAIVVLILALIDVIPVSIGGVGTREAGAILLFGAVGIAAETAVAFSLLYFVIGYVVTALIGSVLFMQKPLPK